MWLLKKLEASFNIYASDGTPLLFEVIDSKDINSELDDILKAGANPNVQSRHPETGELPDNGENLGLKYSAGQTPLIYAVWSGHLSYGKQPMSALVVGQIKYDFNSKLSAIRELLKRGANVNIRDENGLTALHYAARSDYNVQLVKILQALHVAARFLGDVCRTTIDDEKDRICRSRNQALEEFNEYLSIDASLNP